MLNKPYLEKTELSEIAPRPSPATLKLLKQIYAEDGPVQKVYKKFGVTYHDSDFITIINGELLVDKNKEIQGLLPAYGYSEKHQPTIQKWTLLWPTLKNFLALNTIKTNQYQALYQSLKTVLENKVEGENTEQTTDRFLSEYKLIFEINLLSGLALKKLEVLLKNEPIKFLDLISGSAEFVDFAQFLPNCPAEMIGNSLELTDTSIFSAITSFEPKHNSAVTEWWGKLPNFKQKMYKDKIIEALVYNHLRELGRWLTVKNKTILRQALLAEFGKIEETVVSTKNVKIAVNTGQKSKFISLSRGVATGILLNVAEIDSGKYSDPVILYTEILAPDLTRYFGKIVGVVSTRGSLLSHLAIVAREQKIPMLTGFYLGESGKIGDIITIDANQSTIIIN